MPHAAGHGPHRARLVRGVHLYVDLARRKQALLHSKRIDDVEAPRRGVEAAAEDADDLVHAEVRVDVGGDERARVHHDGKGLRVAAALAGCLRVLLQVHHVVAELRHAVKAVRRLDIAPRALRVLRRKRARDRARRAGQRRAVRARLFR